MLVANVLQTSQFSIEMSFYLPRASRNYQSCVLVLQTIVLTYFHKKKSNDVKAGERVGHSNDS